MTYGSSVSRVPERDYIKSLSNFILNEGLLNIPPKHQSNEEFFCQQAATLLREYYIHPSFLRPIFKQKKVKTSEELRKAFIKYVNNKCFDMLLSINWIKQDVRSNLFLITDEAKVQMDQIANQMFDQPPNESEKEENINQESPESN